MLLLGGTATTIRRDIVRFRDGENSPGTYMYMCAYMYVCVYTIYTYTRVYGNTTEMRGKNFASRRDCSVHDFPHEFLNSASVMATKLFLYISHLVSCSSARHKANIEFSNKIVCLVLVGLYYSRICVYTICRIVELNKLMFNHANWDIWVLALHVRFVSYTCSYSYFAERTEENAYIPKII